MSDPSEDPGRHHIGSPRDAVPGGILGKPALHEFPCRLAGGWACGGKVRETAEAMPGSKPLRPGRRRKPARRGVTDEFSGELDLSVRDRHAALCIARPGLPDPQPQIVRHPSNQRMAIEPTGSKHLKQIAPQPRQQIGPIPRNPPPAALPSPLPPGRPHPLPTHSHTPPPPPPPH